MTKFARQERYRLRRKERLARLEALAYWLLERLRDNDKPLAVEIRERTKEAIFSPE